MKPVVLIALLALLATTGLASAGEPAPGTQKLESVIPSLDQEGRRGEMARLAKEKAAARFDAADVNKDGKLSREEVAQDHIYILQNFDKFDVDKDGLLSWEEYVGHNRWKK